MKGIDIKRDESGNILEIHLSEGAPPALMQEVWQLVRINQRKQADYPSVMNPDSFSPAMSLSRFREMIREAKASGELSEATFFQNNPAWQNKKEA